MTPWLLLGVALAADGSLDERVACAGDPSRAYALYRPVGFREDAEWPVLLVLDPRGNAVEAAERFFDAADAYGWVVASSWDTRSDVLTGPDPNGPAVGAVLTDLDGRVRMDRDAVVLAGFSGTARVAWEVATALPDVAYAVLSVGAGVVEGVPVKAVPFGVFLAAGRRDFNYQEVLRTDRALADRGVPHRAEVFDGGHEWPPAEVAARMLGWAEVEGQRRGRRPADDGRIDRALAAERAWLGGIADPWASRAGHDAVARTFEGLRDVSAERTAAEGLAEDPRVVSRDKLEKKLARAEARYSARLGELSTWLRDHDTTPPTPAQGLFELGVEPLVEQAEQGDPEGDAAARSLALTRASLAYYVPLYARGRGEFGDAAPSLAIAAAIWPDDPVIRYDLACAWALGGRSERALDELEKAVDLGFSDGAHLAADPDLVSLRGDPRFEALRSRLAP